MQGTGEVKRDALNRLIARLPAIHARLCAWFPIHGRTLPWRSQRTPYDVWISEVMLQQTQVATVVPYFERWMRRFPDIAAVADASQEDIFSHWQGLGYYRRASAIQYAARQIIEDYDGEIPRQIKDLRKLKGIGPYTAAAIAAFAYDADVAPIDGNVERVLSRLLAFDEDLAQGTSQKRFAVLAEALASLGDARVAFQAIMDLGASVCRKRSQCDACPLVELCLAKKGALVKSLPNKRKKLKRYDELWIALRLCDGERTLFLLRRDSGLLGGLWEWPMIRVSRQVARQKGGKRADLLSDADVLEAGEEHAVFCRKQASDFACAMGAEGEVVLEAQSVKHVFTHIDMRLVIATVRVAQLPEMIEWDGRRYVASRWVTSAEEEALPISTLIRKAMAVVA